VVTPVLSNPFRFGNICFECDRRFDLPGALWQDRREMRGPIIRAGTTRRDHLMRER